MIFSKATPAPQPLQRFLSICQIGIRDLDNSMIYQWLIRLSTSLMSHWYIMVPLTRTLNLPRFSNVPSLMLSPHTSDLHISYALRSPVHTHTRICISMDHHPSPQKHTNTHPHRHGVSLFQHPKYPKTEENCSPCSSSIPRPLIQRRTGLALPEVGHAPPQSVISCT